MHYVVHLQQMTKADDRVPRLKQELNSSSPFLNQSQAQLEWLVSRQAF